MKKKNVTAFCLGKGGDTTLFAVIHMYGYFNSEREVFYAL